MEIALISGLAVIASLVSTLIQKRLMDVELVKSIKADIKKLQKEMKKHKEDPKKTSELMKKSFSLQRKMMGQTIKPTLISGVIILITLVTLGYLYGGYLIFGKSRLIFTLPFYLPFVGNQLGWIWVFFAITLISSFIFKKVFDLGY
jgi:uncharacterized membrane protein (DUF106 family)